MSKRTRQDRKEEELRIVAEMEAAMKEYDKAKNAQSDAPDNEPSDSNARDSYDETMPQQIHCRHCRTLMENGVCPNCGYRIYVPMAKEKRDKIRLILAGICMGIFVVLFIISQFQK